MSIKSIKLNSTGKQTLLIAPALLLLCGAFIAFCWCLGDSVALQAQQKDIAQFAIFLAPQNPQTHFTLAALSEQSFLPDDLPIANREYDIAASLTPSDFRYWLALSKTRERNGDAESAEKCARKAVSLAPFYAQTHWILGNILLRRGNRDEAFTEMGRAAKTNPTFAIPTVTAALQQFGDGDLSLITEKIGDSVPVKTALVASLTQSQKFDDAVKIWQSLPETEKSQTGEGLLTALIIARKFRTASSVFAETKTGSDGIEKPVFDKVANGDFETDVAAFGANPNPFSWQIADGAQPNIALDARQKHDGNRSLIVVFNSVSGQEFRNISQLVVTSAAGNYRFETFAKANDLKAVSTVRWEIVGANDGRVLATTSPVIGGENDWQKLSADFAVDAKTEAVIIRFARVQCVTSCSIVGSVWFDGFSLSKR